MVRKTKGILFIARDYKAVCKPPYREERAFIDHLYSVTLCVFNFIEYYTLFFIKCEVLICIKCEF